MSRQRVARQSVVHCSGAAFTLIEVLITVAMLVIILGLMVSLARHVRNRSALQLTQDVLRKLDYLMQQYVADNHMLPAIEPLLPADAAPGTPETVALRELARGNNEQCLRALRPATVRLQPEIGESNDPFSTLPISIYDEDPKTRSMSLRDAWGSPIVFMASQHQLIGLAPSRDRPDQYFFFSAGPDRKYLTRDDNVYSYETTASLR